MNFSLVHSDNSPKVLLVQPVDSHDMEEMEKEVEYITNNTSVPFRLIAVQIKKWNEEITPWPAAPVFGKIPFGNGAEKTLGNIKAFLKEESSIPVILGGYSLAGLFSLWSGTQYPFDGIVAASPSVWYNDWLDYSEAHQMLAKHVYLSLGDREHRSKTPIMATVEDCIHHQLDILHSQGIDSILEMNPGNHFQDNGIRMAKGFVWAMEKQ